MSNLSSVYIHVPFCTKICSYCDFCKVLYDEKWLRKYLTSLEKEISLRYKSNKIKTIYIGGGTPSCFDNAFFEQLLKIVATFNKGKDIEYTIEFNPEDINENKIKLLKKYGVNRISIGIQTFNKTLLAILNRNSDYEDIKKKIKLLKDNNINNISIDLMYAISNQCLSDLKDDLEKIISLDIRHISTYSLILEKGTVLYNKKMPLISEETDAKMYNTIVNFLKLHGFCHYEISNFAKKGYESKHNLTYWNNNEYYGFGPGASGYINNVRYTNTRNLNKYFNGNYSFDKEILTKKDVMNYEIILGLRKIKGINVKDFYAKYKVNIFDEYNIEPLIKDKSLIFEKDNIYINPDKLYIMNEILIKLI